MKVVILCGGQGTRIRDVTDNIPKPMIPVGNLPILWHIMAYYASYGFNEFIICLGHKGNVIKDFFLNYLAHTKDFTLTLGKHPKIIYHNNSDQINWTITFAQTGENNMTGSRIAQIKPYIGDDENFMLTYGDGLSDVNIDALLDFHKKTNKTLTVTGVRPPGRFGEIVANDDQLITAFNEKPQTSGGRISGGYFVCKKNIFNYIDEDESLVFEQAPIKKIVADNEMALYAHDGFWQPMDTSREYHYLNSLMKKGIAPWINYKTFSLQAD